MIRVSTFALIRKYYRFFLNFPIFILRPLLTRQNLIRHQNILNIQQKDKIMTDLEKQRSDFLQKLGDRQLGIYLAHEGQPSCATVMEDHLTMKQYHEFRRLQDAQLKEKQANIPQYPPFLDEIMTESQAKSFKDMVDGNKWKVLDAWISQYSKYIMRYYEWKNRVLEKKTMEQHRSTSPPTSNGSSATDLSSHFQELSLNSTSPTELSAPEYKMGQDGSIKVLVTVKGDVSGHIIGPQGRTVKSIAKECGVAVNVVRADGSTLVNITSRTKEQLIKAQLKLWDILSLAQAAEVRRHFDDVSVWQKKNDEEKALFQSQYSVSVSEVDGCLQLATYSDELYSMAKQALTSTPQPDRWKGLEDAVTEPLKITIIIKQKKIIGYLIGKNGKTVEWVRDNFNVQMSVTETGDATLVRLTANDKSDLLKAELDIWRSLGKIQGFTELVQDKGVVNLWNNVWQMEEKVRFMNRSNTFVAKVQEMDCLLIRGFTQESVNDSAARLKNLLENGKLPSEDDKTQPTEFVRKDATAELYFAGGKFSEDGYYSNRKALTKEKKIKKKTRKKHKADIFVYHPSTGNISGTKSTQNEPPLSQPFHI